MISFWADRHQRNCFVKKNPLLFFSNLFKKKKYKLNHNEDENIQRTAGGPRVPSNLSVSVVDMRISSPCPISPALSTLTLTPGRTRDIDQDMEALRISRQDNPFLQVLASRESLVDSIYEPDSDDANLMSQDFLHELGVDPLSLPEIHEHMIRSPPPTTWPKSPNFKMFQFPSDEESHEIRSTGGLKSPGRLLSPRQTSKIFNQMEGRSSTLNNKSRPHQRSSSECRHRSSQHNIVVNPYPVGSLSDVRRAQSSEDRQPPSSLPLKRFS